jgi:hypothetical protein
MTGKSPDSRQKPKVICVTCRFKGCLGNCRFEPVEGSEPFRATTVRVGP